MKNGGRVVETWGKRGCKLAGSTPLSPGRTPLSPRATTNDNGANSPANFPSINGRCTSSPSRQHLRNITESARLAWSTPKTRAGKRAAVNSGARVRGSGGGSGRKRTRSRARAPSHVGLQTQVEERLAEAEFDAQQTQARTEALLRKEIANAEADAEARRKAVCSEPVSGPGSQTRGGEILYWKDVAEWLTSERAKLGEDKLKDISAREKVKQMFDSISRSPRCNARVVDIRGYGDSGGDGREKALCLFPKDVRDDVVLGYLLRMRTAEGATLKSELERVAKDPTDPPDPAVEEERMAVVKAAGEIVRRDIELKKSLKNAPARGEANVYAKQLESHVEPPAETLLAMPPTVVGLLQSVIDEDLSVEQSPVEPPKDAGPCKVWERGWREEFKKGVCMDGSRTDVGDPLRDTTNGSAVASGRGGVDAVSGGGSVRPASETRAKDVEKFNRGCRSVRRRLTVMCTSIVKSVLGMRYMPSHGIKATQWAKSKKTPRVVLDHAAEHLGWATDSQVYHRESKFARAVEDSNLLSKCATCAAFSQDNCDSEPRVGVRQGEGPHIPCVACVALWAGAEVGTLDDASMLKRIRDLSLEDVLAGSDAAEGERRYGAFFATLLGAVSTSERMRSTEGGPLWCFEAQLREDITPERRSNTTGQYAFIQRASTKSYTAMKGIIDRILGIWRGTDAGNDGAPCIIAGDEETYRFMYHLMKQDPDNYRQIRRYPGDWHLLYHMAKALLRRFWGAGVEFMACVLGTDNSKSADGGNYRRAHHQLCVMFEALWTLLLEAWRKERRGGESAPVEDTDVSAEEEGVSSEDELDVDALLRWVKRRAEEDKTFALWEQFLLHDFPAYFTFRLALRTGDFKLRCDALRRIAPIFFITGKDRYQFLVADHLVEMARMSESDWKVVGELFSVSLSNDAFSRLGLDERQEVANRFFKTLLKRVVGSYIDKLGPIAQLREVAELEFEREFIEASPERNRAREVALKRAPEVEAAIGVLRECPLFDGDEDHDTLRALDGRVAPMKTAEEILSAPAQARAKMESFLKYFVRKPGAEVVKPTKTKLVSFASKNPTNKATKSKGRTSALKDNIANAYAGGREFKALMLNVSDELLTGGGLSVDRYVEMMAAVGSTVPYVMANAEGGAKHANKSVGPSKWLAAHAPDAAGSAEYYTAKAKAIDLPVWIHQGRFHGHLEQGAEGVIDSFVADLRKIRHGFDGVLLVGYDRQDIVPLIKDREQAGRTRAVGESGVVFNRRSKTPIMPSRYNSWLREEGKAARDGIADALATISLTEDEETWTGPYQRKGITAFYGVEARDDPGSNSGGGMAPDRSATEGMGAQAPASQVPLLHIRKGALANSAARTDGGVHRQRGPDIGEAELSNVHFVVWSKKYFGERITEWLVYSVDTDQWMIVLLAMSTGFLKATGGGHVKVTVEKRVGKESTYIYVNRVFESIRDQKDGSESAWPAASFQGWSPDENEKVRLFVLVYLLAGCDFLPAISGLGFERMWECALKSVRAVGVFDRSIFVRDNGVWNVDIEGCVKLLATVFFFKYESSFKDVCESPGELLRNVSGKVEEYVKCISFVILKYGTARATSVCPAYESMRLQCLRANAVLGYWQDGCKETMPPRDFKDQGWGVDPTLKNFASLDLTKENCVMLLSDQSYIGSDNKTRIMAFPARPAAPPTPAATSNVPPMHNTIAQALRAMIATRAATVAAAAAEAAAAAAETADAAATEAAASAPAEVPPSASEEDASTPQKEDELPESDPDRIPGWLADSDTSDIGSDVSSDVGSDDGWDVSMEGVSDEGGWAPGDD
eukprot:g15026.t1